MHRLAGSQAPYINWNRGAQEDFRLRSQIW